MARTAGPDGETRGDGATLDVALFAQKKCAVKAGSSAIGWAVTTKQSEKNKGADFFKVMLLPEHMRGLQDRKSPILSSPYLKTGSSITGEFKEGRPLKSLSTPIRACVGKSRPQVLYRAVHEDQPGNGLWSRGFGTIKTDEVSFMLHFHHHLDWKRRNRSPFMSTTTNCAKAADRAKWYHLEGFNNVEVLVIKVDESEWRTQSRIWHVRQTAAQLGLTDVLRKSYFNHHEYLVEDFIPASCVERVRWEKMRADIDAETIEMKQSKKRKRSVFESDGPGDGQKRRRWGVIETSKGYSLRKP